MHNIFLNFLSLIESCDKSLITNIKKGYLLIEALSTDDANGKPNGSVIGPLDPTDCVSYEQNNDNPYFNNTLTPQEQLLHNNAKRSFRIGTFPSPGRTSLEKDPLKSNESSNYSADYGQSQ